MIVGIAGQIDGLVVNEAKVEEFSSQASQVITAEIFCMLNLDIFFRIVKMRRAFIANGRWVVA